MSDFLIVFDPQASAVDVLALLRQPYGLPARDGWAIQGVWGVAAVLADPSAGRGNLIRQDDGCVMWVGDAPKAAGTLVALAQLPPPARDGRSIANHLAASEEIGALNGSFAAVIVRDAMVCVITDPMSGVPVYVARDKGGNPVALGTHPDLVAAAGGRADDLDPVSVAEFLNAGTPCCPHTLYRDVDELGPGLVAVFAHEPGQRVTVDSAPYWKPPAEYPETVTDEEIVEEFQTAWLRAVNARCAGDFIGVQLSGGLDSRIGIAAVPADRRCIGLTYLDSMNREARIAQQVAAVYGRDWKPLQRDGEYVGRTALEAIRFTGCEGEWHHAHGIGFAGEVATLGLSDVITGLFMDNNFKGYYARDLVSTPTWRGLRAPSVSSRHVDYVNVVSPLCRKRVIGDVQDAMRERRRLFYTDHFARGRASEWEWLDGHPLSQASDNTGWGVERRLMPLRLPVYDRAMIDLAFRIPATRKASGRIFAKCALPLLGPGRHVPNANDGVRPGSGQLWRHLQRVARKVDDRHRKGREAKGLSAGVPHSWHDYLGYWRDGHCLRDLLHQHGGKLLRFSGSVFTGDPARFPAEENGLSWREIYRVVQLATWLAIIPEYRMTWRRAGGVGTDADPGAIRAREGTR